MNKFAFLVLIPMVLCFNMPVSNGRKRITRNTTKSYKLHTTPATFEEAMNICHYEGGTLAVVNSQAEEQELLDLWKRSGPILNPTAGLDQQAFIGIHSMIEEGKWITIGGDSPGYLNWSPNWVEGQQPSSPSYQKCGSLLRKGGMDDVQCEYKLGFFCKSQ